MSSHASVDRVMKIDLPDLSIVRTKENDLSNAIIKDQLVDVGYTSTHTHTHEVNLQSYMKKLFKLITTK
jgi:hypothetical protein